MAKKKSKSPYNLVWLIGIVLVALITGGYLSLDGCNDQQDGNSNDGKDRPGAVRKK